MSTKQLHKELRNTFRNVIFLRDDYKCKVCERDSELDAHHITDRHEMPNGGYVESNGISLCSDCHWKAEKYHRTDGEDYEYGFHPVDLYKLIGSSFDKAYEDCVKLGDERR
jgi:predicted restriction endonuclease